MPIAASLTGPVSELLMASRRSRPLDKVLKPRRHGTDASALLPGFELGRPKLLLVAVEESQSRTGHDVLEFVG